MIGACYGCERQPREDQHGRHTKTTKENPIIQWSSPITKLTKKIRIALEEEQRKKKRPRRRTAIIQPVSNKFRRIRRRRCANSFSYRTSIVILVSGLFSKVDYQFFLFLRYFVFFLFCLAFPPPFDCFFSLLGLPLSLLRRVLTSPPIVLELVEHPCICECTPDNRIDKHRYYYTANSASDRALTMTPLESQGYCYLRRSILSLFLTLTILIVYDPWRSPSCARK